MPLIGENLYRDDLWAAAEELVPTSFGLEPGQSVYLTEEARVSRVKKIYSMIENKLLEEIGTLEHLSFSLTKPGNGNFVKIKFI